MNTMPFGGGHASAVFLLARRGGIGDHAALSVLALDQLGEGIVKVTLFLLVALLVPLPVWMRATVSIVCIGVAVLFVVLVVVAHNHQRITTSDDRGTVARLRLFAAKWAAGLDALRSVRRSALSLGWVAAMKAVTGLAIMAVQHAFGVDVGIAGTLLVLAAMIFASMLPVAPGNLGTYEASVFFAYRQLGVGADQALAMALVQHVCFMLPAVGIGYGFISAHALGRRATVPR